MTQAFLALALILAFGALATLAALSLRLFPRTRPFATGLAFLAMAATVAALALSAWMDDPSRWSRSAAMLVFVLPAIFLASFRLLKAWRVRGERAVA